MISMSREGINIKDKDNAIVEVRGLSTDEKPTTNITNGSVYIEIDTGKVYFYDADNKQWNEV